MSWGKKSALEKRAWGKKVQKVAGKRRGALDTNSVLIYYLNINLSRRLNCIIAVGA